MIRLTDIIEVLDECEFLGNNKDYITVPINLNLKEQTKDKLMWVSNNMVDNILLIEAGTVICPSHVNRSWLKPNVNYFLSSNPRRSFSKVLNAFYKKKRDIIISNTAYIHDSAKIGKNVSIGHYVTIHENVVVGDDVVIDDHTVIKEDTVIGSHVIIGANCTIGGVGFGYEKDEVGDFVLIPHIGNVVIKDFVEIGNNTTIDRAVIGSTLLEENVKIDNLVHIAHGVKIERNAMIIANAMVAGSVVVGENVWVAPSSSIINGVEIGDNSIIGIGAIILKNVVESDIVVGNPGKSIRKNA